MSHCSVSIRYTSGVALPDKFQGKRTTLDVKMPDLEEPEPDFKTDPANIVSIFSIKRVASSLDGPT